MNRSNKDHEAQALGVSALAGRWTDEGLPLSLRRKLLRKEIDEIKDEARKGAARNEPACPGRPSSRERAG